MKDKNEFLNFLAACVPGVGYMYNGLTKKGIEALAIFLLISPLFSILGLGFFAHIIRILFWFYTFFDTFSVRRRIMAGENIEDDYFIINKLINEDAKNNNFSSNFQDRFKSKGWAIIGWIFIILGLIALINKIFINNDIYRFLQFNVNEYFIPVILVLLGVYLLIKRK
jgi:hypothetical protein